jgi:hypothetical protein
MSPLFRPQLKALPLAQIAQRHAGQAVLNRDYIDNINQIYNKRATAAASFRSFPLWTKKQPHPMLENYKIHNKRQAT